MADTATAAVGAPPSPAQDGDAASAPTTEIAPTSSGNKVVWVLVVVVLIVVVALLIAFLGVVRHWVALHTGTLHGGPDLYYNFWSGFGADLGEATLISAVGIGVYTGVRKVNCHTKGCWRIGHHTLEGTPYILCRHHHPSVPNGGASHEHIMAAHRKHLADKEADRARSRANSSPS